jgi:membrane protease YdiL (CAAX protease family)
MFIDFVESILYLVCVLPFILLFTNKGVAGKLRLILLFSFFFIIMQSLLLLPLNIPELDFIGGSWNWSGKIYATIASLFFYYSTKQHFQNHQYLKIGQSKDSRKKVKIVFIVILLYAVLEGLLFYNKGLNGETLLFQATLPGIDEEIGYRAIMLGLLSTLLVDKFKVFNLYLHYPAIWIIGILFGLIHALKLTTDWSLTFNTIHFMKTFILGVAWSWMTLKTRSIILPMISHNLSNFIPNLIGMLK